MKISKFLSACVLLASAFTFSSCDSESSGSYSTLAFINYEGSSTDGYSQFVYNEPNTNSTITFRSRVAFKDGMTPPLGTRLLGQFVMVYGEEFKNGSVLENQAIYYLSKYGDVSIEALSGFTLSTTPLYLQSIIRAGNYLDIVALADAKNSDLTLVCDANTLNSGTPVLYLNYETKTSDVSETQYFASFDISAVLSQPDVKSIRLILNNANGENEFIFPITENSK
ncbi:MAG: hypothetical protein K2H50_01340 [Paramuribaculum sp.]|nr:hypothetical protein [Paramuribaculum sp.]